MSVISLKLALCCLAGFCSISAEPPREPPTTPKLPPSADPKHSSEDPEFGFKKEKSVRVGSKDELGGPAAELAYLDGLRDEAGKPVKYRRVGNVGAGTDGHIIDLYAVVTSTGKEYMIYLDMYNPDHDPAKQPAPKGLFKFKKSE